MKYFSFCALAALLCGGQTGHAADAAAVETARRLYDSAQDSVVTVKAVVKLQISVGGQSQPAHEQSSEIFGTVLNDKGLIVVSYSALDPSGQIIGGAKGRLPAGTKLDVKSDFKEVKIITTDGDEIPADVVLKDVDLDIAFLKPDESSEEAKNAKYTAVKLDSAATEPQVLDEVILLERMGKDLNRKATVNFARVIGIQKKPRTFYIVNDQNAGTPVFDLQGNLLGIFARRVFEDAASATIILPVNTVAEIAKQAESAKPLPTAKPEKEAEAGEAGEKKDADGTNEKPATEKKDEGEKEGAKEAEPAKDEKL